MEADSIFRGDLSEQRWVDQISKNFDDDESNISDIPVCVFSVPKSITHFKPEAYVPLAIALGPYHHFETHLYQMERYKVAAVKALLNPDQVLSFESLVINKLKEKELMIRASYHKYMNLDDDTLAWIIAIDGLFLLGLFKHFRDIALLMPRKLINSGVLYRDIMVLENQIPMRFLSEIQMVLCLSSTDHDHNGEHDLFAMLREFCEVHSPLKFGRDSNHSVETGYLHLVDLMYHLIVNNQSTTQRPQVVGPPKDKDIPWEKISNLVGLKIRRQHYGEDDDPRVEEIEIPSASCLRKYGHISFGHTTGGIRDIKFEETKATLYLPVITLDVYSEVLLRNLIAYEVATCNSTPELAQYVDLMSGIVRTEEDAKLLRANGIIKGNLNDKEIADLFNGMNKYNGYISSNKIIEELNEYYKNRPMIKAWRFMKKNLLCSKKVATVVVTILLFLLMSLYSFCEVYGCPKLFHGQEGVRTTCPSPTT